MAAWAGQRSYKTVKNVPLSTTCTWCTPALALSARVLMMPSALQAHRLCLPACLLAGCPMSSAGGPVQKHHMLQAPMRMLYKTAGPNIVKFVSNMVNALDAARPFTVGGAVAAYALAGANSEATVKP